MSKVGDVYDEHGRKVGEIRRRSAFVPGGALSVFLVVAFLVVSTIIAVVVLVEKGSTEASLTDCIVGDWSVTSGPEGVSAIDFLSNGTSRWTKANGLVEDVPYQVSNDNIFFSAGAGRMVTVTCDQNSATAHTGNAAAGKNYDWVLTRR
jgi:hypothetical protein